MPIQTIQFNYTGAAQRLSTADLTYNSDNHNGTCVLFLHGFKSFKDWGCWPWLAHQLAMQGHVVVKLNFSHNGVGTKQQELQDFTDLEAFGNNNYIKQLQDIDALLKTLNTLDGSPLNTNQRNNICCIGHSMGGGMAILAAAQYTCITKLITLNAMNNFANLFSRFDVQQWQQQGVIYIDNARTQQQMPLYYQLYENYKNYEQQLSIIAAAESIQKQWCWLYASNDETVPPHSIQKIQAVNKQVQAIAIKNTGHTFGATHPFTQATPELETMLQHIVNFIHEN